MTRSWWVAVHGLLIVAVVGCGPTAPPAPTGSTASLAAPAVSASAAPDGATVVDPALLGLLPADIAGVDLTADTATAAEVAADAGLRPSVAGLAVAAAFGPLATDAGLDYVVVTLARLRPGVFDDAFFRDWRDTFDAAVCEQAGGIDGHAEAEISGHQTFIGTCAGGVRTYHVYLAASNVVVSMQGSGPARYAELVVEGLKE